MWGSYGEPYSRLQEVVPIKALGREMLSISSMDVADPWVKYHATHMHLRYTKMQIRFRRD